jgi:hypothetical protein
MLLETCSENIQDRPARFIFQVLNYISVNVLLGIAFNIYGDWERLDMAVATMAGSSGGLFLDV